MSRESLNQRRAVSLLFVIGSLLLALAAWNLPEYDRKTSGVQPSPQIADPFL